MTIVLKLPCGAETLLDDEDAPIASAFSWHVSAGRYAAAWAVNGVGRYKVYLHRLIARAEPGDAVDHINRNPLDNRRSNLRICSQRENSCNQSGARSNPSGLKGVSRTADGAKWRARIMVNRKEIHLGSHLTKEGAARAYDDAAIKHFGEFAYLNFPRERRSA